MIPAFHGALISGAASFNPLSITGCVLWLDASQIEGLSNNDPVGTWSDLSGTGRHFSQATENKKPLYKTVQQNGLPAVVFDGSNDCLNGAAVILRPMTQFGVISSGLGVSAAIMDGTYSGIRPVCYRGSSKINLYAGSGAIGATTWSDDTYAVASCIFTTTTTGSAWLNGALEINNASIGSANYLTSLQLGAFSASSFYPTHAGEILIYDSVLSDANRIAVENYLIEKWGIV